MRDTLLRDVRYGLRSLRRSRGFAAVIIATLGLGIGAGTAMFSVVNGLLLESLPYPDADRLVTMWQGRRGMDVEEDWFSVAQYVDIKEGSTALEDVTLAVGFGATLTERGVPIQVGYVRTTGTYMNLIGARPALGRVLDISDEAGDAQRVAVISHALWQGAYGGDLEVVGQLITLDGQTTEIVGVLAANVLIDNEVLPTLGAVDPLSVILSLPLSADLLAQRNREDYNVFARLKPGVTIAQAQVELDAVAARIQSLHEADAGSGFFIRVLSLQEEVVGDVARPLWMLLAAVGVLLLIAIANVANLLLSRAAQRNRELSIRAAIGAARPQIIRQLLTEASVLASLGGLLGVGIAAATVFVLKRIGSETLPRIDAIQLDATVLLFAISITATTVFLFALVPAFRASNVDLARFMNLGGRGGIGSGSLWSSFNLPSLLIVGEIALSLVLLIGGGLLGRSMLAIQDVDPGFEVDQKLTFRVGLSATEYPPETRRIFFSTLGRALEEIPGTGAVGGVTQIPFGGGLAWGPVTVPGYEPEVGTNGEFIASIRVVTPDYFESLGIAIVNGRTFEETYPDGVPFQVIVDEQLVERYYGERDPIGQLITPLGRDSAVVAGVVGSIQHTGLGDFSRPTVYLPIAQFPSTALTMVVETAGDPMELVSAAVAAVRQLNPNLAVVDIASMDQRIADSLAERRFSMLVLQTFGGAALLLAAIGIFGLISYRVNTSRPEIGMRMALGAQRGRILRLVLGHGMALALVGGTIGIVASLGVARLMEGLLFGVGATDPATYTVMLIGASLVALLACLVPAYRATAVDPMDALRVD